LWAATAAAAMQVRHGHRRPGQARRDR